ncbi:hypothetical protein AYI68_g149, partial [Smittium mucronatum]
MPGGGGLLVGRLNPFPVGTQP